MADHLESAYHKLNVGKLEEAAALFGQALQANPGNAQALLGLGRISLANSQPEKALSFLNLALKNDPESSETLEQIGHANWRLGRLLQAEAAYRRSIELEPGRATSWMNLGLLLWRQGRSEDGRISLEKAVALAPEDAGAANNLATVLHRLDRGEEALALYRRAVSLDPTLPGPYRNLAGLLKEMGRLTEAKALYDHALSAFPDDAETRRGYLTLLAYLPGVSPKDMFTAHRAYAAALPPPEPLPAFPNLREPNRKLRLGYISCDFRSHPVARNLEPIYRAHDRTQFEIYSYADIRFRDGVSEGFKALSDHWRETAHLSDAQLAETLRHDGIDIAMILAGRFESNRMGLSRHRPAPICVNSHDIATSGLEETDYLMADATLVPPGTPEHFTERVLKLPCVYVHPPLIGAPEVHPRRDGPPLFGAFANPAKINPEVLGLWGKVLKATPGSRLRMKYRNVYAAAALRKSTLLGLGVTQERVEFLEGWEGMPTHLNTLGGVDILLDTLPFSGATTTFEGLWMGVPTVTLAGKFMVGRWSATLLKAIGRSDLIATTPEDFVRIAHNLALDPARLAGLRQGLRAEVASSSLCDGALRTRQIERWLRSVWRKWAGAA
ncbi:MAG: hypothetical protein A2516_04070 [Alphaproteobacteria bacterium RIFOXYD12_FULL_60_8]|nr:MAG: hypothetical protein A2516_04070 [Alphaproteobacteria bacterium RIFOXYD12_FULL_60_8]